MDFKHPWLPLTEDAKQEMLKSIGKKSLDELFSNIPEKFRLKRDLNIAESHTEIEVARRLRRHAEGLAGRERLAVMAFAEAIEVIPTTLAENAGMDPIDALSEMQSRHTKGEIWTGLNGIDGEVSDMAELDVYEPLVVKAQAIKSATESSTMLLKIDDMIAASKMAGPPGGMPPGGMGGMPGGMGGMPGGMPPMM